MLYAFKTKRNANGHRKTLAIWDYERIFTSENNFFSTFEFTEIKSKDRDRLIKELKEAGYTEISCNEFRKRTGF